MIERVLRSALVLACVVVGLELVDGCKGANAPTARDEARGAVLVVAHGVAVADTACAAWGEREGRSGDLARVDRARDVVGRCNVAAHHARDTLIAAEAVVDTWDAAATGRLACLVAVALPDLEELRSILAAVGEPLSPAVDDGISVALRLAPLAVGSCTLPLDAGARG